MNFLSSGICAVFAATYIPKRRYLVLNIHEQHEVCYLRRYGVSFLIQRQVCVFTV